MKKDYKLSEQLFLDVWEKYGSPEILSDKNTIYMFLNELVEKSDHYINMDHFSEINFDKIDKIVYDEKTDLFKFYWEDNNKYRLKYLNHTLEDFESLTWIVSGCCTYEYFAVDIHKIMFYKYQNHLFIFIHSNMIDKKKLKQKIVQTNELVEEDINPSKLYNHYTFWEGAKENCVKVSCIANYFPYYVCLIQPKENTYSTHYSKLLMLMFTLRETRERIDKVHSSLKSSYLDNDELSAKGNTVRIILEYTLKHFCTLLNIPLKDVAYKNISLGDLKNSISRAENIEIEVSQRLINLANEFSHDSGKIYTVNDLETFVIESKIFVNDLHKYIYRKLFPAI